MPAIKDALKPLERAVIASGDVTGTYQLVKTLEHPAVILRIVNASNQVVDISYDGATDHDAVDADMTMQLEIATNSEPQNFRSVLARNTKIFVKGTAGQGNIYITGYYHEAN